MKKKVLAILLCFSMVICLIPSTVFANEEFISEVEVAEEAEQEAEEIESFLEEVIEEYSPEEVAVELLEEEFLPEEELPLEEEFIGSESDLRDEIESLIAQHSDLANELDELAFRFWEVNNSFLELKEAYDLFLVDIQPQLEEYNAQTDYDLAKKLHDFLTPKVAEAHNLFDGAQNLYNELQDIIQEYTSKYEEIIELEFTISSLIENFANQEQGRVNWENFEAWKAYWQQVCEYKEAYRAYLHDSVKAWRDYQKEVASWKSAYSAWLEEMKAYGEEYDAWLKAKEEYDSWFGQKKDFEEEVRGKEFKVGSFLLNVGDGGQIWYHDPGNNAYNGNKHKVNPNDGVVKFLPGLTVDALGGESRWPITVDEDAVGKTLLFWAHGNHGGPEQHGELIKVVFEKPGIFFIGTDEGMNHLIFLSWVDEEVDSPGEPPVKQECPQKPCPPEIRCFEGVWPEKPECESVDGIEFVLYEPVIFEIEGLEQPPELKALFEPPENPPEEEERDRDRDRPRFGTPAPTRATSTPVDVVVMPETPPLAIPVIIDPVIEEPVFIDVEPDPEVPLGVPSTGGGVPLFSILLGALGITKKRSV